MDKIKIKVAGKEYTVKVAKTDEEKAHGLQDVKELSKDEGMLFIYDEPSTVTFWMKDTYIPLDIIFIGDNDEVLSVYKGEPGNTDLVKETEVLYVLELNANSEVKEGDDFEIEDSENLDEMNVLDKNGNSQMKLEGGERIFSRKNTVILIRMAKRANQFKDESHYRALGNKVFKYLNIQDSNKPEYVDSPDSKKDK